MALHLVESSINYSWIVYTERCQEILLQYRFQIVVWINLSFDKHQWKLSSLAYGASHHPQHLHFKWVIFLLSVGKSSILTDKKSFCVLMWTPKRIIVHQRLWIWWEFAASVSPCILRFCRIASSWRIKRTVYRLILRYFVNLSG